MRQKLIDRLKYWRDCPNGFASDIKYWKGWTWKQTNVHIKDLVFDDLSDDDLLKLLEDVVANFEHLSHD